MAIDYERAFKKLKEQIDLEYGWASNDNINDVWSNPDYGRRMYDLGMRAAYRSIKELSDKLSDGSFVFDGQYDYMLTENKEEK